MGKQVGYTFLGKPETRKNKINKKYPEANSAKIQAKLSDM